MYPHQGGRWSRAQFNFFNAYASVDDSADGTWNELLAIQFHVGDPNTAQGDTLTAFARHIEVRAIRCVVNGIYQPSLTAGADWYPSRVFAGLAIDSQARDSTATMQGPLAATLFDPFVNERPIKSIIAPALPDDSNIAQPVRWLKREWHAFQGGNFQNAASTFQNSTAQFRRNLNVSRRFRLDDFNALYAVGFFSYPGPESAAAGYLLNFAGCIWYRVSFGR